MLNNNNNLFLIYRYIILKGMININHTTQLSKILIDCDESSIITIWDATYIYIQKSSNYELQRKSFSMHKRIL